MSPRGFLVLWLVLALAALVVPAHLQTPAARADFPTDSKGPLSFEIDARLDAQTHDVVAQGVLTWENRSPVPVPEMRLHLYLNAFRDERSTFMRESQGSHRGHRFDKSAPGWIRLTSFKRQGGEELIDPERLEYVYEDDGNVDDRTVVRIPLRTAIEPGASATFHLGWTSRMPRVFARTGQAGGGAFFMVAQWYPKPGVWEQDDVGGERVWRWNCHQFHGSSEFYADYGRYDVRLTVPQRFEERVGATGLRLDLGDASTPHRGRRNEDGTVTYRHVAEHVHDFAWVCGENFVVHERRFAGGAGTDPAEQERVARILGRALKDLDLPEVTVYFLLQPEHEAQLARHERAVFHALTYMGFWYGPYPYPTLTVVDPDHRGRDAGGMEYPTLITGGTGYVRASRQLSPEGVLVHEFGHQHFYGLVGTNEFRHAWLDEGLTTYATAKVLGKAYAGYEDATWYAGLPHYGKPPLAFRGLAAEARKAAPFVGPLFDERLKLPFGELGLVQALASGLGVNHPPERISLWANYGEVTPLAFMREVPGLTHLRPLPGKAGAWERRSSAARAVTDPISGRRAWEYMDRRAYGTNSYARTAASLRTLEGYLGEETVVRALHAYCKRYRFQHPGPEEFFVAVEEVARKEGHGEVRWLLDELFEQATTFDFGIEALEVEPLPRVQEPPPAGPGASAAAAQPDAAREYESLVVVRRYGGVRMPIDVRVRLDDGRVREFLWDRDDRLREYALTPGADGDHVRGALAADDLPEHAHEVARVTPGRGEQQRWAKLRLRGPAKVVSAEVDPLRRLGLDRNLTNDGLAAGTAPAAALQIALRALGWVELSNSWYGGL